MSGIPSLMVMYTDDGLEVRYSDGSRLQLSPCGSCMLHEDPVSSDQHPLAGIYRLISMYKLSLIYLARSYQHSLVCVHQH